MAQQMVRRYNFTTAGKVHEVTLMRQGNTWRVYVDDKSVGTKSMDGTNECVVPFKVDVPGLQSLDAFITMEAKGQLFQYTLCVHGTPVEAWWTLEGGEKAGAQTPEILDAGSLAQWDAPNRTDVRVDDPQVLARGAARKQQPDQGDLTTEDLNLPSFRHPRQNQSGNSWLACCAGGNYVGEVSARPRSGKRDLENPTQAVGNPSQHACCAQNDNYDNRPLAKTCNDGGMQCSSWAEEVFA